jgi:hypothetical protein
VFEYVVTQPCELIAPGTIVANATREPIAQLVDFADVARASLDAGAHATDCCRPAVVFREIG